MAYSRIIQSDETILEFKLDQERVELTRVNLVTEDHTEAQLKLSKLNNRFNVGFTNETLKITLDKLEKSELKFLILELIKWNKGDKVDFKKLLRIIHGMYAKALGLVINPSMVLGVDIIKNEEAVGVYLYCIQQDLFAFKEDFLRHVFHADCSVGFEFLDRLSERDLYHSFSDFYSFQENIISDSVQRELTYYCRKRKAMNLLS